MKIFYADKDALSFDSVVALGDFDGLHTAHMAIIRSAEEYGIKNGLESGVLLFDGSFKNTKKITGTKQKTEILKTENLYFAYICKFSEDFRKMPPDEFAEFLAERLNVKAVCVGYDYTFGRNAEGNADVLKALGKKMGFDVIVTDRIDKDGITVSSTYIRSLIENGNINKANELLGRRFFIEGRVLSGYQNGRKMQIPTANIEYGDENVLPKSGVYAGITHIDGKEFKSVINVGNNPTFGADKITIESHVLNFDGDLYGKNVRVDFMEYLRSDRKFRCVEELKAQIEQDIKKAEGMM